MDKVEAAVFEDNLNEFTSALCISKISKSYKERLLFFAMRSNAICCFRQMIKQGWNTEALTGNGTDILITASSLYNSLPYLETLVRSGRRDSGQTLRGSGDTALHVLCQLHVDPQQFPACAQVLLNEAHAKACVPNKDKKLPIDILIVSLSQSKIPEFDNYVLPVVHHMIKEGHVDWGHRLDAIYDRMLTVLHQITVPSHSYTMTSPLQPRHTNLRRLHLAQRVETSTQLARGTPQQRSQHAAAGSRPNVHVPRAPAAPAAADRQSAQQAFNEAASHRTNICREKCKQLLLLSKLMQLVLDTVHVTAPCSGRNRADEILILMNNIVAKPGSDTALEEMAALIQSFYSHGIFPTPHLVRKKTFLMQNAEFHIFAKVFLPLLKIYNQSQIHSMMTIRMPTTNNIYLNNINSIFLQPRSLQHLCCSAVYQVTTNHNVAMYLQDYPLPTSLKRFLIACADVTGIMYLE